MLNCYYEMLLPVANEILIANEGAIEYVHLGGAVGWDTAMAIACTLNGVPFAVHIPKGHGMYVPYAEKRLYHSILEHAHQVLEYGDSVSVKTLRDRNVGIVAQSEILTCMWDSKVRGGTAHAVKTAMQMGRPVFNYHYYLRLVKKHERKDGKPTAT